MARRPPRRTPATVRSTRAALATGTALAEDALRRRNASLRRRAAALRRASPRAVARAAAEPSPLLVRAVGAPSPLGTLLAEGDSWFDYPLHDVLKRLEEDHGFDVESVARMGDNVEDMAYDGRQFEHFTARLDRMLRYGIVPRAVLLSGGGNDLAGGAFHMLIDHALSPAPGVNADVARGIIDVRIRNAYITLISAITTLCRNRTGAILPIVVHGYDRPVPDGRGFLFGPFPGPWLKPGFDRKGFQKADLNRTTAMMATLIDQFNAMLAEVAALNAFGHVHYIDLRGTLSNGAGYRAWWANELHPTGTGFAAVAAKFAAVISAL